MSSITIRNLDDDVIKLLQERAAENNWSIEDEVRSILHEAVSCMSNSRNLAEVAQFYFGPDNGVDLELPPRESGREPPSFD